MGAGGWLGAHLSFSLGVGVDTTVLEPEITDWTPAISESELHDRGAVASAVARLREQGHVFDEGGAVWLRTTDFGDDKDRVMIRADGEPTYFAADAAYYLSKKDRGFDQKIYLLGADHHGYIHRLKAIAACAGDDPEHNI